ncbi:MAG TPA: DNA mismatch repair endonuclease MutL [Anaerolineales bacterium]
MTIRLLAPEVSSQIAAGEVIERPASVVKELIENAIDAGATAIAVTVGEAGRKLIEVADDGSGIAPQELSLAVERHATSKLSSAEDLFHISTLGFRGEALASVASVSRLTITTKTSTAGEGARLRVEGGHAAKPETIGGPAGTVVHVEDLFYNVPARLKFLKADVTERRVIDALMTRYALAYPRIRFKLMEDQGLVLQTSGDGDRRAILAALYGVEIAKQLLEITAQEPDLGLTGFISPTTVTRSNRRDITVFVNGRWVQDTPLTSAFIQAYHTMLMVGRYPLGALFLEVEHADVDVNVHPAKAEVRFKNPDRVFGFVQRAVRRGLLAYTPVPAIATQHVWGAESSVPDPAWELAHAEAPALSVAAVATVDHLDGTHLPLLRLIGQIGATYMVAEGPDGLYLIDQHAAHERVLFEKLLRQHEGKAISSQALLSPVAVTLPPEGAVLLASQLPALRHLGFEVEEFGPNTFQVRAVPALFGNADPSAAIRALVEDFEEDEAPLQNEIEKRIAARVCKRMAVKAGQVLSAEEQHSLVADLEACDSPRTCPHGRPTMIHLSVETLERQFGRRGAR